MSEPRNRHERRAQDAALRGKQPRRYLTAPQVRQRYGGISEMTLWRWVRSGNFPKPRKINNRNYFDEAELDEHDDEDSKRAA